MFHEEKDPSAPYRIGTQRLSLTRMPVGGAKPNLTIVTNSLFTSGNELLKSRPLMLDISITLVVIAHIVVSLLLILVILMQRPKQEGLGAAFGSGMTDAAWGARTTDVLQKGTVYLGTLFFVFSLVLAILMGKRNSIDGKNFASDGGSTAKTTTEAPVTPETAPAGVVSPAEEAAAAIQDAIEAETGGLTPVEPTPSETTPVEPTPAETLPADQ
ncbi:MAG: preprotein translocase subunit SecG [Paracoccaceae bacterium]|jgi:preprotein translocase subunit SecG